MNFLSFTSIFKTKPQKLTVPDTILVKKLKNLSSQSSLHIYKDVNIYHHAASHPIGLLLVDIFRGVYLFETKQWTYDELKNADIQKAKKQKTAENTLSFENTRNIIRQKFNELTHTDGVPIFNFLLMENLNADEYEHLNDSFKELLPQEKVIFSDSNQADIFKKLQSVAEEESELASLDTILGTLFIQYTFLDSKDKPHLGNSEQITFIDASLPNFSELTGVSTSGKSELLLIKAIDEILSKNAKKIIILKPTVLACDLLKKKFLDIIEHAIIEIDLEAIEIITPLTLLNRHRQKMSKEAVSTLEIEPKLLKKLFYFADIIFCDDAHILEETFINYLKNLQKSRQLLLVKNTTQEKHPMLCQNYRSKKHSWRFHKTQSLAKALRIIEKFLANDAKNIVLVADKRTRENLQEDLNSFITLSPKTLKSNKNLLEQKFSDILFCGYEDINAIKVDHIILMDLCSISENLLEYAINLSNYSADILYEEECSKIQNLRSIYEQSTKE